jgi:RF-1 domain
MNAGSRAPPVSSRRTGKPDFHMPSEHPHPASRSEEALLADCDVRRTRRSGPGGQHRNKVETAVVITHRPTGLVAEASERRSQAENQRVAVFRLRMKLACHIRLQLPPGGVPSALWQTRCRAGRLWINPEHDDFPTLLAEALDRLASHTMDFKGAAAELGCTPSQLLKLLKSSPQAWTVFAVARQGLGLPPLH